MNKFILPLTAMLSAATAHATPFHLYLGTAGTDSGILTCSFNPADGSFGPVKQAAPLPSAGFLAQHPTLPRLYSITRAPGRNGPSAVAAYAIAADGSLTHLSTIETGDVGITHLEVAPNGKHIAVAHYAGGSTALLALDADGRPTARTALVQHTGSSIHKRQKQPYAHGVAFSADSKHVYCADLGADKVIAYVIDAQGGLKPTSAWTATPGAGPRHLALHPDGTSLFSINELNSTLSLLHADSQGGLKEKQTVPTLPKDFTEHNTTAEVVVHPGGQFVYSSNRGHNSVAAFRIHPDSTLTRIELEPTQGGHPRHIALSPDGAWLIAANRDSNNLVSFSVDPKTGALTPSSHQATAERPICVVFRPAE